MKPRTYGKTAASLALAALAGLASAACNESNSEPSAANALETLEDGHGSAIFAFELPSAPASATAPVTATARGFHAVLSTLGAGGTCSEYGSGADGATEYWFLDIHALATKTGSIAVSADGAGGTATVHLIHRGAAAAISDDAALSGTVDIVAAPFDGSTRGFSAKVTVSLASDPTTMRRFDVNAAYCAGMCSFAAGVADSCPDAEAP